MPQIILYNYLWYTYDYFYVFYSMNELRQKPGMIQNYLASCPVKTDTQYLFQIKVKWLSLITLFGVLSSFIFCILWTILFKLDDATSTHCGYHVTYVYFLFNIYEIYILYY